jgi:hypothetical protein
MAKSKHDVGTIWTGKSPYGSHTDMIVNLDGHILSEDEVLCKDERGVYKTLRSRLDTGLADANRWSVNRKNYESAIQK